MILGIEFSRSRILSVVSSCRLKSYKRSISILWLLASLASSLARLESLLDKIAVTRKALKETQFCGSAIVNFPMGGKKKKLIASVERIDVKTAFESPHLPAINKTYNNSVSDTVV